MTFSAETVEALTRYAWPGNIRELDNVIARAVVLSPTDAIEPGMLALMRRAYHGAGPVAQRTAEVTGEAGHKLAERARQLEARAKLKLKQRPLPWRPDARSRAPGVARPGREAPRIAAFGELSNSFGSDFTTWPQR